MTVIAGARKGNCRNKIRPIGLLHFEFRLRHRRGAPMKSYILALDQGTTSSRAILFDRHGQPVATLLRSDAQLLPCWPRGQANS